MKTMANGRGVAARAAFFVCAALGGAALSGCNTLQHVELIRGPARTMYGQGQNIDLSGLAVTAYYKKNVAEVSDPGVFRVSGYDRGRPGEQTVTATLRGKGVSFTVTVVPAARLTIVQQPAVTVFREGEGLSATGLLARVEFERNAVPAETVGPGRLSFSGFNKDKPGAQSVTAAYYGARAAFDVRVAGLSGIAVVSAPYKTTYFLGEPLELAGLAVRGMWDGLPDAPVSITSGNVSGYDVNRAGTQNVAVTWAGKVATFPVTNIALSALSVVRPPRKTEYEVGEALELEGIMVHGTWPGSALSLIDVSRLRVSGYDKMRTGEQKVTVTVGGKSDTFVVTVGSSFEGKWYGKWVVASAGRYGSSGSSGSGRDVELIMTKNSWSWKTTDSAGAAVELSGAYTPDRKGHIILQCADPRGEGEAEIAAPAALTLTCGYFGTITFTR